MANDEEINPCACAVCCYFMSCCWSVVCCIILLSIAIPMSGPFYGSLTFGDSLNESSGLITVSSEVSSITLTTIDNVSTIVIYATYNEPMMSTELLLPKTLDRQAGLDDNVYTYIENYMYFGSNYIGTDKPIYLLPGSVLLYNVSIFSADTSLFIQLEQLCIYVFSNSDSYFNFKLGSIFESSYKYVCHTLLETITDYFSSFDITDEGTYYVGIVVQKDFNISSTVSVLRVQYNTTELAPVHVCTGASLNSNEGCSIMTCDSFMCTRNTYILLQPSDSVMVYYNTTGVHLYDTTMVSFFFTSLTIYVLFMCCYTCCCCVFCLATCSDDTHPGSTYSRSQRLNYKYAHSRVEVKTNRDMKSQDVGQSILQNTNFEERELDSISIDSIHSESSLLLPDQPSSVEHTTINPALTFVKNLASVPTLICQKAVVSNTRSPYQIIDTNKILTNAKSRFSSFSYWYFIHLH